VWFAFGAAQPVVSFELKVCVSEKKKFLIGLIFLVVNILLTQVPINLNGNVLLEQAIGVVFAGVFLFPLVIMGIACIWKDYRNKKTLLGIFFNLTIFIFIAKIFALIPAA